MHDIDKFASDAAKIVSRSQASAAGRPESSTGESTAAQKLAAELSRHFEIWTRDYGNLGSMISQYWKDRYTAMLATEAGRTAALVWLEFALALISGNFTADMDFPDDDWAELREIVSSEAEELDLELLTTILGVIVERGKA